MMPTRTKLLLLLGPSGVGKTTIVRALEALDERFVYVTPLTTRPLRPGETDKISVSVDELEELSRANKLVAVNELYGAKYGTLRGPIERALRVCRFPLLDWPIASVSGIQQALPQRLHRVYIEPPSLDALWHRLQDGRDPSGDRFARAESELAAFARGEYRNLIDHCVVNHDGEAEATANGICLHYQRNCR